MSYIDKSKIWNRYFLRFSSIFYPLLIIMFIGEIFCMKYKIIWYSLKYYRFNIHYWAHWKFGIYLNKIII